MKCKTCGVDKTELKKKLEGIIYNNGFYDSVIQDYKVGRQTLAKELLEELE